MKDTNRVPDPRVSPVIEEEDENEEERFDYTDSEEEDQDDSMLTVAGSPRRIKPWSFMDSFNPKKQALAIAREIDAKKGIKLELPSKPQSSVPDTATGESSTQSTIRRVPSGAKAPPSGHNLRASTPVETGLENGASSNGQDQSIDDVAGQSTPLTLARITNGKPREIQGDVDGVSNGPSQPTDDELLSGLRRETIVLKEEISKLKAQVAEQNAIQAEREEQLRAAAGTIEDSKVEFEALKVLQQTKDDLINSTNEQLGEVKKLLETSEQNRLQESETKNKTINDLKDELKRKDNLFEESRKRSLEVDEKYNQRREKLENTIDELKERLNSEREAAFNELRASNTEWQKRFDDREAKFMTMKQQYESDLQQKLSKVQEDLSQKIDDLHNVERELKDKCKQLEMKEIAEKEAEKKYNELQTQHTLVKEELTKKADNVDQLQNELKNTRVSQEKIDNNNKKAIRKLEDHIDQLEKDLKRLQQLQKTLQSDTNKYKEKLQEAERHKDEIAQELQRSKSTENTLQSEVTALIKKSHNNEELLKSTENELQSKISAINEKLKNAYEENDKLMTEVKALNEEAELRRRETEEKLLTFEHTNEELNSKVKSLTKLHDDSETKRKDAEARLSESSDKVDRLTELSNEANEKIKVLQDSCGSTKHELLKEQQAHEITSKNAQKVEEYSENLTNFVENLTLFDLRIGSLALHAFRKNNQVTCLDPFLTAQNSDIIGFHVKSQDQRHRDLEKRFDTLNLKNQQLVSQIENHWKSLVDNQKRELSQQKCTIDSIDAKFKEVEIKLKEHESRHDMLQDEKVGLLKQKDDLIQEKRALNDQLSVLRGSTIRDEENKINQLVEQIKDVTMSISAIREQVKLDCAENGHLKATIKEKDAQLISLETKLKDQEIVLQNQGDLERVLADNRRQISKLQELYDKQQVDIEEKTHKLQKLEGDNSRRITFDIARQSRPDITRDLYEKLMISKVDSIDMIELQNIVKNLILLLEIPFNKLTKKVPLVAMYLKYERPIFSHFANRLHFDLFKEAIDMKRFTNEAYDQYTETHNMAVIKHPLESCLDNLYQMLVSRL